MTKIRYTPANLIRACDYMIAHLSEGSKDRGALMLGRKHNEILNERRGQEIKRVSQNDWEMWAHELDHSLELHGYLSSIRDSHAFPTTSRRERRHFKNKHRIVQLECLLMHIALDAKLAECEDGKDDAVRLMNDAFKLVLAELSHYTWTEGRVPSREVQAREVTEEVGLDIFHAPEPDMSERAKQESSEMDDAYLQTVPGMGFLGGTTA